MSDKVDKSQSFRLACDRCRAHKLRCPQDQTSAASGACQRCLRAKTQCTFSPRARAGKLSKSTASVPEEAEIPSDYKRKAQGQVTITSAAESLSSLDGQTSSISELGQGLTTNFLDPEWMHYGNFIPQPVNTKLDGRDFDGFTFDVNTTNEFPDGTGTNRGPFENRIANTVSAGTLGDTNMGACCSMGGRAGEMDDSTSTSERAQTSTPLSSGHHGSVGLSSAPSLSNDQSDDSCMQKLSTLAVDFHRQLEKLNHGPWAENTLQSGHSMGSYPIGDILLLSQELINVLLRVSWNAGHDTVDVSTALLALNCYVSLVRTYSVVFAHLSQYLRAVTSRRSPQDTFHPAPGLLFEELQPSNEACNRTHAAFQMLLGTLARIENILDLPGEYRCARAYREPATFDCAISSFTGDIPFSEAICSNVDTETLSPSGHLTAQSGRLVGDELLQAVLKREASSSDGGGIMLLRKHVDAVKVALREEMAL